MDATAAMDRIYRHQRHFYDLTRKLFLFGRDSLLRRMRIREGDRVLEVGCGTGRNLFKLRAWGHENELYGLDASTAMLATAAAKLEKRRNCRLVSFKHGLAQELFPACIFDVPKFDVIFFSYSLSMIPECTASIDAALRSLVPNGRLYIVDFCDQAEFPPFVRKLLGRWLSLFGVKHRPEIYDRLAQLAAQGYGTLTSGVFGKRYGIWSEFSKSRELDV